MPSHVEVRRFKPRLAPLTFEIHERSYIFTTTFTVMENTLSIRKCVSEFESARGLCKNYGSLYGPLAVLRGAMGSRRFHRDIHHKPAVLTRGYTWILQFFLLSSQPLGQTFAIPTNICTNAS